MVDGAMEQLNGLAGRRALRAGDRLSVTVAPDRARFSLRAGPDGREGLGTAFGCALPARIGGLARSGDRLAACLGPDEWLLMAPEDDADGIVSRFAGASATHSLVDISHREIGIEIRGEAASWALGALCPLDLDAMEAGSATRTILDRAQVVLIRHGPDHYRLEVWQSFSSHVWELLAAVAREVSLGL